MRACVLYDDETWGFTPAEFIAHYPCEWEMITLSRPVFDKLKAIRDQNRFDVFFNLCDGASDEDYPGLDVVQAMEELNMPFTGSDSKFYDQTREEMQSAAETYRVGFAKGYHVTNEDDLDSLVENLHFPLMVKHPKSYSSIEMTRDSRVEEFIVGREYNVFVVDNPDDLSNPFVYPPTELIFPPGDDFWHTDIKWDYSVPFEFREVKDPFLYSRLQEAGRQMYLAAGGTGYGRCDVRVNEQGGIYILEINANCGILYPPEEYGPADYMILYDKDGYYGFFDRIFRSAIARQKLRAAKQIR